VVGAGPSGATAARWCAKYGFSTLLIDQSYFPRDKTCGGMVSPRAIKELDFEIQEVVKQEYYEAKVFSPKNNFVKLKSSSLLAIGVLRKDFDQLLIQKAQSSGVTFLEGKKAEKISLNKNEVRIFCKNDFNATADVLIAADGVNSIISNQIGIRKHFQPDEVGLACVSEVKLGRNTIIKSGFKSIEFYIGLTPAGYGWIFPKGDYLSVGAASLLSELRQTKTMFPNFVKRMKKLRSIDLENLKWHLIPIGGKQKSVGKDRIIMTGDAAGFVDPIIGEGITYSILSGKTTASSIRSAFETRNLKGLASIYWKQCKDILSDLQTAYFFARKLYYHGDLILDLFAADDKLGEHIAEVVKGNINYREFLGNVIRRMPVSVARAMLSRAHDH
jgi:geranylgeranyl reductase family protein